MMAIKHDMISMSSTNAASIMAPWGGVTETLGNNPIYIMEYFQVMIF
ncbi:hypothetical protein [Croceibacter atlanticus]